MIKIIENAVAIIIAILFYVLILAISVYAYPQFQLPLLLICTFKLLLMIGYLGIFIPATPRAIFFPESVEEANMRRGSTIAAIPACWMASNFLLYLAAYWNISLPRDIYTILNFENMVFRYIAQFLDDFLRAIFHLDHGPIQNVAQSIAKGADIEIALPNIGGEGVLVWSGRVLANLALGVASGLLVTWISSKWMQKSRK